MDTECHLELSPERAQQIAETKQVGRSLHQCLDEADDKKVPIVYCPEEEFCGVGIDLEAHLITGLSIDRNTTCQVLIDEHSLCDPTREALEEAS